MDTQERLKKLEELKKQREDIDRLILELTEVPPASTNIPYAPLYTELFQPFVSEINFTAIDPNEFLQIKMFVNKKCNQISTDYAHTVQLVSEILPYKNMAAFKEIFLKKLLDQGRVQVSGHFESYKPFSFLLFKLDSPEIIKTYVRIMIMKAGSESELKGMYAIYFGVLDLSRDIEGCWKWLASVLNTAPNKFSGYVLETFLLVCGDLLHEQIPVQLVSASRYIKKYYLKELGNAPVETRILAILAKYDAESKKSS